jgi:dinuclear metal center YbgI/SA1388 family protein
MRIERLLKIIDDCLPAGTAMDGDRIGLQVQSGRDEISNLLIALELNDQVIDQALKLNSHCIISFHPLIYSPLVSIQSNDRVGHLISRLIKNDIALIVIHTNFDAFKNGTSKVLADKLDLNVIGFLEPDSAFDQTGMGVIAEPKAPINESDLLQKVHSICGSPIRFSELSPQKDINKIAIVGGSGSSFLNSVINAGVDAFITADVTYHKFHQVFGAILLIDPGHYEMEQFVPEALANLLKEIINPLEYNSIDVSNVYTNPVRYYPETELYIQLQKKILLNKRTVE